MSFYPVPFSSHNVFTCERAPHVKCEETHVGEDGLKGGVRKMAKRLALEPFSGFVSARRFHWHVFHLLTPPGSGDIAHGMQQSCPTFRTIVGPNYMLLINYDMTLLVQNA